MRQVAYLNRGIKIIVEDARTPEKVHEEFCYKGGIKEYVLFINNHKTRLFDEVIYCEGTAPITLASGSEAHVYAEIAMQYDDGYSSNVYSFCNNVHTHEGGMHETGFRDAMSKMMNEVNHLLEGRESVTIAFSDKKALFTIGTTVVATRLIAGDYPNTKNIVPKVTNYLLEVNANDLMKAIERANILSIDRENIVDLSMSEDSIEISAKSSQVGSAVERIDVFKYVGQNLHISFNSGFVIEAVKALGSADVTLAFVGEMKPFVVENASDDSVVQIVTPIRTY